MLLALLRWILGYLKICITGYSTERFLNLCKNKKIDVWGLEAKYNGYEMFITIRGFRKIKPILKKTRTKVYIKERVGLPFFFHKYRKRKLFFAGIIGTLLMVYGFTFFIWNIELEGNQAITDNVLMEYLKSKDITHGTPKHKIDCMQLVKDIRKNFDEIIWVSAHLEGTHLYIEVKENGDTFVSAKEEEQPSDIVSNKTGKVVSIITRNGVPKVVVGTEVASGDLLVSGTVEVLNDAKEVVSFHHVVADADIIIETTKHYEEIINKKYKKKVYTDKKKTLYKLRLGNSEIELGIKKHKYQLFDSRSHEFQCHINEQFYLPLYFETVKIKEYEYETLEYSKEEMETLLRDHFQQYCAELKESGVVILESNFNITHTTNGTKGESELILQESVGVRRKIVDLSQVPMVE